MHECTSAHMHKCTNAPYMGVCVPVIAPARMNDVRTPRFPPLVQGFDARAQGGAISSPRAGRLVVCAGAFAPSNAPIYPRNDVEHGEMMVKACNGLKAQGIPYMGANRDPDLSVCDVVSMRAR
jgi:hypothetical protein